MESFRVFSIGLSVYWSDTGDWGWLGSTPVTSFRRNITDTDPIQAQAYKETHPLLGSINSGHNLNPYLLKNAHWCKMCYVFTLGRKLTKLI